MIEVNSISRPGRRRRSPLDEARRSQPNRAGSIVFVPMSGTSRSRK